MPQEILLELQNADGALKTILIPLQLLATDEAEVLRRLKAAGFVVASGADHHVIQYLIDRTIRLQNDYIP